MPTYCAVRTCRSNNRAPGSQKVTVHHFPPEETLKSVRDQWIEACGRENFVPTRSSAICKRHFTNFDYILRGRKGNRLIRPLLKSMAVPTKFLPTAETNHVEHDHMHFVRMNVDHDYDIDEQSLEIGREEEVAPTLEDETKLNQLLQERIQQLEAELAASKAKNVELEEKIRQNDINSKKVEENLAEAKKMLQSLFNEDQLKHLKDKKSKAHYSANTLKKAIKLYYTCGTSGYNLLREEGYPLPALRTIQRHLKKIPFRPGTLDEFIKKMEPKVKAMKPEERIFGILMDELYLNAHRDYDSSNGCFVGHPTIDPPPKKIEERARKGEEQIDRLATQAMAAMIVGLSTRVKQLIGYHFTDSSFDPKIVKEWITEMIVKLQAIGLKIYFIGLDMGPGNQAL